MAVIHLPPLILVIILSLSTGIEPSPLTLMGRTLTKSLVFLEKKSVKNDAKWVKNDAKWVENAKKFAEERNRMDTKLAEERSRTDTKLEELKNLTQMKELMELKDFVEIFNNAFACGNDSVQLGKRCYKFEKAVYTWYQARDACAKNGGHLASITSKGVNDLIVAKLPGTNVWLSGNDIANDGKWVWHDGKAVGGGGAYTNWHGGYPRASEHCMYIHTNGRWYSSFCGGLTTAYVCETRRVPHGI